MPVHTSLQQVPVQRRSLSEEEQVIAAVAAQGIPAYVARATIIELRESGQPISPAIVGAQFDPMALMPIIAGLASPAGGSSGAGGSGRAPQGAREAGPIQLTFSLGQLNIHIGTSGYDFEWWRRDGGFYPPRCSPEKEFVIYSESFNTIELNATFYRKFPDSTTWDNWRTRADRVRPSFTYVIKCNKFFTHHKNLKVDGAFMERWQRFWGNCKRLGSHLGPLLFQFPASFATSLKSDGHGARTNLARLEKLAEVLERGHKFAFEFRHPSWYCEDVYALCRAHDWAFVTMDLRNCHKDNASGMVFDSDWMGEMTDGTHPAPGSLPSCASWGEYVRFHGADGKYTGAYGEREMQRWAMRAQQWAQAGKAAFFMFNNTDDYNGPVPSAIADSRTLARCLWPRVGSVAQHA
ncbi:hypothetical protein WJX72_008435 [[Myrmecia] bisecta]|uniref:DUF72 domain-containing protein n=1 Tax=[Myrmecia] bisecta TaxID=41462 RepID=A0AAW1P7X3_9CHLO